MPTIIIDHMIPLKRGGPDAPVNMQWQTIDDAKAKDSGEVQRLQATRVSRLEHICHQHFEQAALHFGFTSEDRTRR